MTPEQLAKMQAGRAAALAAKKAQAVTLANDEDAQWRETHERWHREHNERRAQEAK